MFSSVLSIFSTKFNFKPSAQCKHVPTSQSKGNAYYTSGLLAELVSLISVRPDNEPSLTFESSQHGNFDTKTSSVINSVFQYVY